MLSNHSDNSSARSDPSVRSPKTAQKRPSAYRKFFSVLSLHPFDRTRRNSASNADTVICASRRTAGSPARTASSSDTTPNSPASFNTSSAALASANSPESSGTSSTRLQASNNSNRYTSASTFLRKSRSFDLPSTDNLSGTHTEKYGTPFFFLLPILKDKFRPIKIHPFQFSTISKTPRYSKLFFLLVALFGLVIRTITNNTPADTKQKKRETHCISNKFRAF